MKVFSTTLVFLALAASACGGADQKVPKRQIDREAAGNGDDFSWDGMKHQPSDNWDFSVKS